MSCGLGAAAPLRSAIPFPCGGPGSRATSPTTARARYAVQRSTAPRSTQPAGHPVPRGRSRYRARPWTRRQTAASERGEQDGDHPCGLPSLGAGGSEHVGGGPCGGRADASGGPARRTPAGGAGLGRTASPASARHHLAGLTLGGACCHCFREAMLLVKRVNHLTTRSITPLEAGNDRQLMAANRKHCGLGGKGVIDADPRLHPNSALNIRSSRSATVGMWSRI